MSIAPWRCRSWGGVEELSMAFEVKICEDLGDFNDFWLMFKGSQRFLSESAETTMSLRIQKMLEIVILSRWAWKTSEVLMDSRSLQDTNRLADHFPRCPNQQEFPSLFCVLWVKLTVKQCHPPSPSHQHFYKSFPNGWFMTLFYPIYSKRYNMSSVKNHLWSLSVAKYPGHQPQGLLSRYKKYHGTFIDAWLKKKNIMWLFIG